MSNCSWNCQLAVGDNQPIRHPLAVIVGRLVGYDVADRRAGGSHDSIPFFSSDKRRIARQFQDLSRASNVRFVPKADIKSSARQSVIAPSFRIAVPERSNR
jgi:hypothetical protein